MIAKFRGALMPMLLAVGCNSTGVGNPGVSTQSLVVTADPELEPAAASSEELLAESQLQRAILVIGEIRFLGCESPESNTVVATGPFVVDLARNLIKPALPELTLPPDGLCGIDAVLAPAKSSPEMSGRSLLFRGTRSDGTIFLLFANMEGTLRLRPRAGQSWDDVSEFGLLWAMRPRRWLLPAELDESEPNSLEGERRVIVIDLDRHPVLYEKVRSRLGGRSTLHLDLDADARLDATERQGDAWVGVGLDVLD